MTENEFNENQRIMQDYKQKREEKYKQDSRDRLGKIVKKKIETTMIGALSSVEEHFGFLWGRNEAGAKTEEQKVMEELFQQVRSEILDRGNTQSRNIEVELANYDVSWKKYSLKLPVKPRQEDQNG